MYIFADSSSFKARTGWISYNGNKYYGNSNGVLKTGWFTSGSSKYYFYPSTRIMATGTVKIDGTTYKFSSSGVLQSTPSSSGSSSSSGTKSNATIRTLLMNYANNKNNTSYSISAQLEATSYGGNTNIRVFDLFVNSGNTYIGNAKVDVTTGDVLFTWVNTASRYVSTTRIGTTGVLW